MKLTYNNPDRAKELNPLSIQEVKQAVAFLNHAIEYGNMSHATISIFQKLITNYELYEHFHTVVGGWDGLTALRAGMLAKSVVECTTDTSIRECEGMPFINPKDEIQCNKCKGYDLICDTILTCNPPNHYKCQCCGHTQTDKI